VEESQCWWERQPRQRSILDIVRHSQLIRGADEAMITIEAVSRVCDDYMVALLHDGHKESGLIIDFPPRLIDVPSILEHVQSIPRLQDMQVEQVLGLKDRVDVRSRQMLKDEFPDLCCIYIRCIRSITSPTSLTQSKAATGGLTDGTWPSMRTSDRNIRDVVANDSSRPSIITPSYSGIAHLCQNDPSVMSTDDTGGSQRLPPQAVELVRNTIEQSSASTSLSGSQSGISTSRSRLIQEENIPLDLEQL